MSHSHHLSTPPTMLNDKIRTATGAACRPPSTASGIFPPGFREDAASTEAKNACEEGRMDHPAVFRGGAPPRRRRRSLETVSSIISVMRIQEETHYRSCDYLSSIATPRFAEARKPINEECRRKMLDWCNQVIDYCNFSRETAGIAMSYTDRYLSSDNPSAVKARNDRKQYQLLCMTAFYIAIKIHESDEMEADLVSKLSRGCYSAQDVTRAEMELLNGLGWRLGGPTPLDFCRHFLELGQPSALEDDDDDDGGNDRVSAVLLDLCQHQIEQATAEYRFVGVNPSTIAAAAVLNGLDAFAWEGVCAPSSAGVELRRLVSLPGSIQRTARIELASPQVRACRKVLGGRVVQLCAGWDMRRRLEEAVGTAAVGRGEEGVALLRPRRESLGRSGSPVSVVP